MDIDDSKVFGILTNKLPYSFLERTDLEILIKDSIANLNHIVVYGGTKQGKSSLLNYYFKSSQKTIKIKPSLHDNLDNIVGDIYKSICRKYDLPVNESKLKMLKSLEDIRHELYEIQKTKPIDDTQVIIIENYHYIIRQDFAKGFLQQVRNAIEDERPLLFIFVGIVKGQDITHYLNGDLGGRLTHVTLEPWSDVNLNKVIDKGLLKLGLKMDQDLRERVLRESVGNVGIMQVVMSKLLEDYNKTKKGFVLEMRNDNWISGILGDSIQSEIGGHSRSIVTKLLSSFEGSDIDRQVIKNFIHYLYEEISGGDIYLNQVCDFIRSKMPNYSGTQTIFENTVKELISKESSLFQITSDGEVRIVDSLLNFYIKNTLDYIEGNQVVPNLG